MRLSGLDMAFVCLEDNSRPMHMGALLVFQPPTPVHPVRIARLLADRAQTAALLNQTLRSTGWPLGGAAWTRDDAVTAENHIHTHRLRTPAEWPRLIAALMARPLPLDRPPWQAHVITGIGGTRFAVLATMHHALADATGALTVAAALLDGPATPDCPDRADQPPSGTPSLTRQLAELPQRAWQSTTGLISRTAGEAHTHVRRVGQLAGIAAATATAVRPRSVVSPVTSLVASSTQRRLASVRLDADELRRARKQFGGTFHDVVLSVIAGGLGSWLRHTGTRTVDADATLRVLVPVSLRGRHTGTDVGGNHLSGYLVDLPVGEPDPLTRLHAVRASMHRSKTTGTTRGAGAFPLLADALPALAHRLATPLLGRTAPLLYDTMITTAPIPDTPLHLDRAELREFYPVAPLAPGHGLSLALATYHGHVHIGLLSDAAVLPNHDTLSDAITTAAHALHEARINHEDTTRSAPQHAADPAPTAR